MTWIVYSLTLILQEFLGQPRDILWGTHNRGKLVDHGRKEFGPCPGPRKLFDGLEEIGGTTLRVKQRDALV